ncbi:sensor histidine kinase [Novispirillum sp. DQ9]|uniref:sensor histidine kinase n=1 Tax=Novispirillum sp. DQ9 TaxID=3398612 RepID=UPI003C7B7B71
MVRLDVGTLAFASAMLALAVAATILFVAGRRGRGWPRLLFSVSAAAYGTGVLPIILWPGVPLAVLGGNLLVMASACAAHAGVCQQVARRPAWSLYGLSLAIVGGGYALSLYGVANAGVAGRIMLISAVRIPFFLHAALLLRGRAGEARSALVLQVALAFVATLLALRILDVAVAGQPISDFVGALGVQAIYFTGVSAFLILLGVSFVLSAAEAEEAYLKERIEAQTEALRQAKEVAENALAAKSRFLAATGHDLRQAVQAMTMLLAAVTHELSDRPEQRAELADLTDDMARVVATMSEQLNALLEIARLDNGAVIARPAPVPMAEVFARLEGQYARLAEANDTDLRFVVTSAVVMSDPVLLLRLVGNLVDNAIKFGRGGRVVVGCRCRDATVDVQVWDEGIGIAPAHLEDIFEDYRQIDGPRRGDRPTGLGLGLAIVRRTADLLDHQLHVRSVPGRGSVFSVAVPRVSCGKVKPVFRGNDASCQRAGSTELNARSAPPI